MLYALIAVIVVEIALQMILSEAIDLYKAWYKSILNYVRLEWDKHFLERDIRVWFHNRKKKEKALKKVFKLSK
ncbi:MAG: hypothetical protein J6A61_05875 [Clostridia bacterium]|nr:hypothetical protein [Clostridia bacterium]